MTMIKKSIIYVLTVSFFLSACSNSTSSINKQFTETQQELQSLLLEENLSPESTFAIVNQIANNMLSRKEYSETILFLTTYVDQNPDDMYNAYWLLMTALAYIESDATPIAKQYFDRILNNYVDLAIYGKSVHLVCLENLIQLATTSTDKIFYYTQLITRFADSMNPTPIYYYLAMEYEKTGEWEKSLRSYTQFLVQPDAVTIRIPEYPDAYEQARKFINFYDSPKNWTFESLEDLTNAVQRAIRNYDPYSLDRYKSKVNFFAMAWGHDASDANSLEPFSMRSFMVGNRVGYSVELDESSNPNEAYLRTWGWTPYMPIWYLYFRKVYFPLDHEIHGRWEWAGIYYGEKL